MNNTQTSTNQGNEIYNQVIEIARSFLGPSAERFINRQIEQHLSLKAENLTKKEIPELAKWVKISAGLITDKKIAADFEKKILELG